MTGFTMIDEVVHKRNLRNRGFKRTKCGNFFAVQNKYCNFAPKSQVNN